MNALSGLQKHVISIDCRDCVGLISVAHQAILRCSCRMRRERLIRPTKTCNFNRLQRLCRPDKRSASGNFAFATILTPPVGGVVFSAADTFPPNRKWYFRMFLNLLIIHIKIIGMSFANKLISLPGVIND
ncbi:hypothetical protein EYW98_10585 [Escherichia coli]|nr:hypothetical protein [Escherichia coli]EGO8377320.1 hypothetical protein [Escherichia coli]